MFDTVPVTVGAVAAANAVILKAANKNDSVVFKHISLWILRNTSPDNHSGARAIARDVFFGNACAEGNLEFARWISHHFMLTVADVRVGYCRPLTMACSGGHLGVVRWMFEKFELTEADSGMWRGTTRLPRGARARVVLDWLIERHKLPAPTQ